MERWKRPERRRGGAAAKEAKEAKEPPPFVLDASDPLEGLARGLHDWGATRLFVAAFQMDFGRLVRLAIAVLPHELQGPRLLHLAESEELPRGEEARLYGLVTGITRGSPEAPEPVRFRLVPPVRLPDCFRLLLEDASRRADDDPVRSYWVPLSAISSGSITVVDAESVKLEHPLVVFRISQGGMRVAVPAY